MAAHEQPSPGNARVLAVVSGSVQGVGYRYFVQRRADAWGIKGHVRNLRSGEVEVVAEGARSAISALLADLHRGPSGASVSEVRVTWQEYRGEFERFSIAL